MNWNLVYLILLIFDLVILAAGMVYTWLHLEAKGARSLFLLLLMLFGFTLMFTASLFTRTAEGRQNIMYIAYIFIMLIPLVWVAMTYELTDSPRSHMSRFLIPLGLVNVVAYVFLLLPTGLGEPIHMHSCTRQWLLNICLENNTILYWVVLGIVVLELIAGCAFLLWYFSQPHQIAQRNRYLFLVVSVIFGGGSLFSISIIFTGAPGLDPMPIFIGIIGVMFFYSIFSRQFLVMPFGDAHLIQPVDDILLVVDSDHYIQDVNMSTLNVFEMDVKEIIDVQLEHAFVDYPEIVQLFNPDGFKEELDLPIDGEIHTFEPSLISVRDPQSGAAIGQRLQLRDITQQPERRVQQQGIVTIIRDPLTNQYTRESFFQFGEKLARNSQRMKQPFSLAVVDIDDFRSVNQRFSHLVGDQALIQLVEIINRIIRSSDLLARFEGDELVLLLPKADEFSAYQVCARIKEAVAAHRFSFQNQEFQITVSIGYTVHFDEDEESCNLQHLVNIANEALEQSHALGRNRLTFLPEQVREAS